jgi:hypothetical protein
MEILLEKNPQVTCYNCSDGARILVSKPLSSRDIDALPAVQDKSDKVEELLTSAFSFSGFDHVDFEQLFAEKLPMIEAVINHVIAITSVEIHSRRQLALLFTEQYRYIREFSKNPSTAICHRFLNGTLNYFQANIMTNVYLYRDKEQQKKYIRWAMDHFHEHLLSVFNELKQGYNKPSKV